MAYSKKEEDKIFEYIKELTYNDLHNFMLDVKNLQDRAFNDGVNIEELNVSVLATIIITVFGSFTGEQDFKNLKDKLITFIRLLDDGDVKFHTKERL